MSTLAPAQWSSRLRGGGLAAELLRGTTGSIAIAVAQKLLVLGSSVILARVLGPAGFGVYAFAMSIVILLAIPAQFGMGPLLIREIAACEATGRWALARGVLQRAWQFAGLATVAVALATVASVWKGPLELSASMRWTLTWAVFFMTAEVFGRLCAAVLMGRGRVIVAQLPLSLGRPVLFLSAVAVVWWLSGGRLDPPLAMATNAAVAVSVLLVALLLAARALPRGDATGAREFDTRRWLGSAVPFALLGGLALINAQTDIVMLGMLTDAHDLGVYRVAIAGAGLLPLLLGAVNTAIAPTLARLHGAGDRARLVRIVRLATFAGTCGGGLTLLVLGLWGQGILGLVFGPAYVAAWGVLMILGAGQLLNAAAGPVALVLNMTGHERDSAVGLAVAAVANIALNALLIPLMGLAGAALATAIATGIWNVLLVRRVRLRLGLAPIAVGLPSRRGAAEECR